MCCTISCEAAFRLSLGFSWLTTPGEYAKMLAPTIVVGVLAEYSFRFRAHCELSLGDLYAAVAFRVPEVARRLM